MVLQERLLLLKQLQKHLLSDDEDWLKAKQEATWHNAWFTEENIDFAVKNICNQFLDENILNDFVKKYALPQTQSQQKTIGIVMAGNLPLVGFHDFLMAFLSGHKQKLKLSNKDKLLFEHIIAKLISWNNGLEKEIILAEFLKNCDAYIATGSSLTGKYFEQYFGKFPHIIRKSRVSVAILNGSEAEEEMKKLCLDIFSFFGLGCRNVRKLFVPEGYDFIPLLDIIKRYDDYAFHHKYKNNYDYNLAIAMLNRKPMYATEALLLTEEDSFFSPIAQLNYSYYNIENKNFSELENNEFIQCIVGHDYIPFGQSQSPTILDYADGIDTMQFLKNI